MTSLRDALAELLVTWCRADVRRALGLTDGSPARERAVVEAYDRLVGAEDLLRGSA